MTSQCCLVLIAAPDTESASQIGEVLVVERLAACVQTVPISSVYRWAGQLEHDSEVLLLAKTRLALLDELTERVRGLHSYDVPEIVALPIIGGDDDYLAWVSAETREPGY